MNGYQSFPIYDFKGGLQLDKEPWLLPKDAFASMLNAFIHKGILQKRQGYEEWGRFVHAIADEALDTTVDLTLTYSGTLAEFPIRAGDFSIATAGGGEAFTDDGDGTLTGGAGGSGTIDYDTGDWEITYNSNPGNGHAITADYDFFPGNAIMGIYSYYTSSGSQETLIFDTVRVNYWDKINQKLEDLTESDEFTGDAADFFWAENWKDVFYATNNNDQQVSYNGTTLAAFDIDYDGDLSNDIDTCLFIFPYKGRLVLLRTTEKGTVCPQRARWCNLNDPSTWSNADYVDAPTVDWIMGADFLGDDLVVFFERSVWMLKYTGDATLPFKWVNVASTEGCYAPYSTLPFSDEIIGIGATSVVATDALDVYSIDTKIPDFMLSFNPEAVHYSFGAVLEELRQGWITYASLGQSYPDKALVLNYDENTFSTFDIGIHCIGYYEVDNDLTWDDIDATWDEIEWMWDEKTLQAGYPTTIGGDRNGYLYILNSGGTDNGEDIELEIKSSRWNPYMEQGLRARLGKIGFYVDRDPNISVTVSFYKNNRPLPYKTVNIAFGEETDDADKVWVWAFAGDAGDMHSIKLSHTASNQTVKIHAIVPYFKPAGRIAP